MISSDLVKPTAPYQAVRFLGYGGDIRQWHLDVNDCVVIRFTRKGNPVVRLSGVHVFAQTGQPHVDVTDTLSSARRVTGDGKWLRI